MYLVHVEHDVPDYDAWKAAFDGDPLGREQLGGRRHRIMRAADDPGHVMIDLELDTREQAEALVAALRGLWERVDVMRNPGARVAEIVADSGA